MHHFATTAFPRRWMTLPEVSERIGVRYKTIYKAVSKASALRSSWVKHEPYPSPDGPQRWLVDTEHELFRLYLQRWQRRRHKDEVKDTSSPNPPFDPFGESYEDADDEAAAQPYMNCPYVNWRHSPTWTPVSAELIQVKEVAHKVLEVVRQELASTQLSEPSEAQEEGGARHDLSRHYRLLLERWHTSSESDR